MADSEKMELSAGEYAEMVDEQERLNRELAAVQRELAAARAAASAAPAPPMLAADPPPPTAVVKADEETPVVTVTPEEVAEPSSAEGEDMPHDEKSHGEKHSNPVTNAIRTVRREIRGPEFCGLQIHGTWLKLGDHTEGPRLSFVAEFSGHHNEPKGQVREVDIWSPSNQQSGTWEVTEGTWTLHTAVNGTQYILTVPAQEPGPWGELHGTEFPGGTAFKLRRLF